LNQANCGNVGDHYVLAVGFNSTTWKIRNSWGASWGEDGYAYLARGTDLGKGQCGILLDIGYPTYS